MVAVWKTTVVDVLQWCMDYVLLHVHQVHGCQVLLH